MPPPSNTIDRPRDALPVARLLVQDDLVVYADASLRVELGIEPLGRTLASVLLEAYPERATTIERILGNRTFHRDASTLLLWAEGRPGLRLVELDPRSPTAEQYEVRWKIYEEEARRDLLLSVCDWITGDYADSLGLRFWESDRHHRFTIVTDSVGTRGAHPQASSVTGRTRWELAGVNDPAMDDFWRDHRDTLDAHCPFAEFEYDARAADGTRTRWSVSGRPRFTRAGSFLGYRGVVYEKGTVRGSAPPRTPRPGQATEHPHVERPLMLVVDDQRAVRRSIRRMFVRMGWDAAEADSAETAMETLVDPSRKFDLVIADVVMPGGMDGIALAERIRQDFPGTVVVLVSGHRPREWDGPVEILEKPFSETAVLEAARRSGLARHLCAPMPA